MDQKMHTNGTQMQVNKKGASETVGPWLFDQVPPGKDCNLKELVEPAKASEKQSRSHVGSRQNLIEQFKLLVYSFICIRSVLSAFMLGKYLRMQSHYLAHLPCENFRRIQLEQSISEQRLLVRRWGLFFRYLGPAVMLGYFVGLAVVLIFCLGDKLTNGHLTRKYKADKFVMFYSDPPSANKCLEKAFNRYLSLMILLNRKERLAVIHDLELRASLDWQEKQLLVDLDRQQAQLRLLERDKSTVWPPNRADSWRQKQKEFLISFYKIIYISAYSACLLLTVVGVQLVIQQVVKTGDKPLYLTERINIVETYWILNIAFDKFFDPMILLVINFRDKKLFLLTIRDRFEALMKRMIQLKVGMDRVLSVDFGEERFEKGILDMLRSECDEEALRIYLSLRVFLDELKPTIELASIITKQYFSTALTMLFTVPFCTNTDLHELVVLGALLLYFVSIIDTTFLVCAQFESACIKTTQQTWSLVACLTQDIGQQHESFEPSKAWLATGCRLPAQRARMLEYRIHCSFNQTGSSVISEHMAMLWRRFTSDMAALHGNFHCKIFGIVHLNYSGMLRLNFWFISVILTFLSQQRFK